MRDTELFRQLLSLEFPWTVTRGTHGRRRGPRAQAGAPRLRAAGDETLTGTKYLRLYGAERMPEKHQERFLALQAMELKTARAWVIKETLRHLWSYQREGWARRHWTRWYFWATQAA